jgi:hypothetical protein
MSGSYKKISLPDFARALEGNLDVDHLLMLGAGASKNLTPLTESLTG